METLLKARVVALTRLAEDITGIDLAPTDDGQWPRHEAGAHIDVHVGPGLVRQYSLYQLPAADRVYRIGVLRDANSRGGSSYLAERLKEGDILQISPPRNHFPLAPGATHSVLLAGGIGITPILSMAQQLASDGASFDLHYCGRSLARMAFLEQLAGSSYASRVRLHADDGEPAQRFDARAAIGPAAPGRHLYVCGPGGFMDHVLSTARDLGWTEDSLHREYFGAAPVDSSGDGTFEIELRPSGRVVVIPAGQSAAQALLDAGVSLSVSCEQGVCGTCMTPVVEGTPDHRDLYLTEEERSRNDCFLPCCSRALTPRLVVDLR